METATLIKRLDVIETETKAIRSLLAKPGKVTDRIKTVEDAFNEVGKSYEDFQTWVRGSGIPNHIVAEMELEVVIQALNEGWTPNWEDGNERKYTPWMQYKKGSGFVYGSVYLWHSFANVGSRLCFKNAELAKYAATQFVAVYNRYLVIK